MLKEIYQKSHERIEAFTKGTHLVVMQIQIPAFIMAAISISFFQYFMSNEPQGESFQQIMPSS